MAQREALKDLQARLAARLQAAQAQTGVVSSWLAVEIAGQAFLLPLAQAGEIASWRGVHRVPYTQPWFVGVANIRSALIGVVNLVDFVNQSASALRSEQELAETSLLMLNPALEVNVALLVDRLAGLRGVDDFAASMPPPADAPEYFGSVYTDSQGRCWQELNLQRLAQAPTFLGIGT